MNTAVSTDRTRRQWVDLGIHTEACMTRPETCGAGGPISLWLRIVDCENGGILATTQNSSSTGLLMICKNNEIG